VLAHQPHQLQEPSTYFLMGFVRIRWGMLLRVQASSQYRASHTIQSLTVGSSRGQDDAGESDTAVEHVKG